ncbi:uncharacterized protein LOC111095067 isoform X1 [Canis lupus familiaris]|uniref:uncharacterized protein LOC111095067 isoform X1 n=1 Tax=Canis lupus familiaris TaxID=9615 RepID=UPI0018F7C4CD|nr:uncharacterized protein LOC111095067 isoform X1 [Canis lupus familiaris]XP_038516451.1 uncharacterized protein LOC111095067 isoform X1 [Canis lupus familiaris]
MLLGAAASTQSVRTRSRDPKLPTGVPRLKKKGRAATTESATASLREPVRRPRPSGSCTRRRLRGAHRSPTRSPGPPRGLRRPEAGPAATQPRQPGHPRRSPPGALLSRHEVAGHREIPRVPTSSHETPRDCAFSRKRACCRPSGPWRPLLFRPRRVRLLSRHSYLCRAAGAALTAAPRDAAPRTTQDRSTLKTRKLKILLEAKLMTWRLLLSEVKPCVK